MNDSSTHHTPRVVNWYSSSANGGRAGGPTVAHIENGTERPVHMLLAESWYRAWSKKTGYLVGPGPEHYLKAESLCARMDPKLAESTIAPYFSGDWWFTKDKNTKKPNYSFGGWVAHVTDILAAGPVKGKAAKGWECPACGAMNTHSGQVCMECKEGREGA